MNVPGDPAQTRRAGGRDSLVSVVVPCKNRARWLPETLDSILAQGYRPLEVVVADGGSSDGTVEVLRSYEGRGVRWFSRPDRGAFDAINEAWAQCTGDILAWLNADDCYTPGAIDAAVGYLEAHPEVDVVHGACDLVDDTGRLVTQLEARPWSLRQAVLDCDHIITQATAFVRREAIEAAGGLYPAWTHDQELWLRIGLNGGRIDAIDRVQARVRIGNGHLHLRPEVMIPARVAMTERILADAALPGSLRRRSRRIRSNAHLRGFEILEPLEPSHWPWAWRSLSALARNEPAYVPRALLTVANWNVRRWRATQALARWLRGPRTRPAPAPAVEA